jgi:hypothetical protein
VAERNDVMSARLKELVEAGQALDTDYQRIVYNFGYDGQTNCGSMHVEYNEDTGHWDFSINLGPVNARKLLEVLRALEDEPDEVLSEEQSQQMLDQLERGEFGKGKTDG